MRKNKLTTKEERLLLLDNQVSNFDKSIEHHRTLFLSYLFPSVLFVFGVILKVLEQPTGPKIILFILLFTFSFSMLNKELRRIDKLRRIRDNIHIEKDLLLRDVINKWESGNYLSKLVELEHGINFRSKLW